MKQIVIENCYSCPYYKDDINIDICRAFDIPKKIKDCFEDFPSWCPLSEYELFEAKVGHVNCPVADKLDKLTETIEQGYMIAEDSNTPFKVSCISRVSAEDVEKMARGGTD